MDVTCTRCGTTYEFEEGLVSTTGTTVKCTTCGHLFKLHRSSDAPPAQNATGAATRWRIRRADGSVHTLESLSELTPLIQAGQFRKDDAISRSGKVWKRLGEVTELAALFEAGPTRGRLRSDPPAAVPASMPSERPPASDPRPTELTGPPSEPPPPPRPRRSSGFESMGVPIDLQSPLPSAPPSTRPPTPMRNPLGNAARSAEPARIQLPAAVSPLPPVALSPVPVAVPAPMPEPSLAHDLLPDDEPVVLQPPRSQLWIWVLMVSIVLAGGAVVLGRQLAVQPPNKGKQAAAARDALKRADDALASDRTERFAGAIADYEIARKVYPDDPHILSSLSRVYAVWAQALRFAPAGADEQAQRTLLSDTQRLAEQAKRYGERAAQRNPGNEEGSIALSDARRLTNNLTAAREELGLARAAESVPTAEALRVAALLAIDDKHGDLHAGRKLAEQSVAQDPLLIRSRFLLARILAYEGDREGALLHLDAVRAIDRSHPQIEAIERAMNPAAAGGAGGAPASAGTTLSSGGANGGVGGVGGVGRVGGTPATAAAIKPALMQPPELAVATPKQPHPIADNPRPLTPTPTPTSNPTNGEPKPSPEEDPVELSRRGEHLLESGSVTQAARAFERALQVSPGFARAQVGLAYVALENGEPKAAVPLFRAAASSGNAEALIGLGDSFRRLGKLEEALRAYKGYVQRFPRGDKGSIARHQIEELSEQVPAKP